MKNKNAIKKSKKAWPTKAAMSQVYQNNLWGSNATKFFSGEGSHKPEIIQPYLKAVSAFLQAFKNPITVCDLGCGDFNIGKELFKYTNKYYAIDIVPNLIDYNKKTFEASHLEFKCLDIAEDSLPSGDCAILRQVLQHLSNKEVQTIISKLYAFKYVILTEHVPYGNFEPNKDIISGQGIRLKKQSGINLLAAPFYFKVEEERELASLVLENKKGVIVTTLYTLPH